MSDQPDLFEIIARNTVAVLTSEPEHKKAWIKEIKRFRLEARFKRDKAMVTLLGTILHLIEGKRLDKLTPDLSGPYLECWERIKHGLVDPAAMHPIIRIVLAFINAPNPHEKQGILEMNQEILFSDQADEIIRQLIDQNRNNPNSVRTLEGHRYMIGRCRERGIAKAFVEWELQAMLSGMDKPPKGPYDLAQRIEICQRGLTLVDREEAPQIWAKFHNELAINLSENPIGDRNENLEQAISHYNSALEVYDKRANPVVWGATVLNLASAYVLLERGNRADHIEKAIELFETAFEVVNRKDTPELWTQAQSNLGGAYSKRTRGKKSENMERAIQHCNLALELRTRESNPHQWAQTINNLGSAYMSRIVGDKAENIESAIECFQVALEIRTRDHYPEKWLGLKQNLGFAYLERIVGDSDENILQGIAHLEDALEVIDPKQNPNDWAEIQSKLGGAYLDGFKGKLSENLERAIQHYELELSVHTRKNYPFDWASAQYNLGMVYFDLRSGSRTENLEQALVHLQAALEIFTKEDNSREWASIQDNLGNIYAERYLGRKIVNIELAIDHHRKSLEVRTRENLPVEWARTHHNLANAYQIRILGEKADNLERSLQHLEQAASVRTWKDMPIEWAMTQHSLGTGYLMRINGRPEENIERAIHHLKQALLVRTREALPQDWALTTSMLAWGFSDRKVGDRTDNLEQAIRLNQSALEVFNQLDLPMDWARTQLNLGSSYSTRIKGNRARNIEQCIRHYKLGLSVYTCEEYPDNWATANYNLGKAYKERIYGQKTENYELALTHFRQALEIYTIDGSPNRYKDTQLGIGALYFDSREWPNALIAYQEAAKAGQQLLSEAYTETGRRAEVIKTSLLYTHMAYCLLQMGRYGEGLVTLERGKTRLLAEALALGDVNLDRITKEQRSCIERLRKNVRTLAAESRLPIKTPGRRTDRELSDLLHTSRAELNEYIEEVQIEHPDFMPVDLDLQGILRLIPKGGALVVPLATTHGASVFIVPHGVKTIDEDHVLWLDDLTSIDLYHLLFGSKNEPGWLQHYISMRASPSAETTNAWLMSIENITSKLWNILMEAIYRRLSELEVTSVILMPSGGLQLLPIHVAWYEDNHQRTYFMDRFDEVKYAPSAYTLDVSQRRAIQRSGQYALVGGVNQYKPPLPSLQYACPEARTIAELFNIEPLLNGELNKKRIQSEAQNIAYLHLSCHGGFAWGQNPLESGLILGNDDVLNLAEIISGDFDLSHVRLVTLSACETGITEVSQSPDEYVGLPAGFLQAGATAVVSSLWTVDDLCTALLMERFYTKHLQDGFSAPAALKDAQCWLRGVTREELGDAFAEHIRMNSDDAMNAFFNVITKGSPHDKPYTHPFYWAAFIYTGM